MLVKDFDVFQIFLSRQKKLVNNFNNSYWEHVNPYLDSEKSLFTRVNLNFPTQFLTIDLT